MGLNRPLSTLISLSIVLPLFSTKLSPDFVTSSNIFICVYVTVNNRKDDSPDGGFTFTVLSTTH